MAYLIFTLCAVAGWGIAQPMLATLRSVQATRAQAATRKHAQALRALRMAKGR